MNFHPPVDRFARHLPVMALVGLLLLAFCGCAIPQPAAPVLASQYRPQNIFSWGSSLPPSVRRVALMPMACDASSAESIEGRDALEPIMRDELTKLHRFEVIPISCEALQARTGRPAWNCEEALPHDLFTWLTETRGCDAVLFCRLTVFRGYAPLAVGWQMRLVELRTRATLWASDETFDAGRPGVQLGARRSQLAQRLGFAPAPDRWVIQNSPRQFGQYAAARLVATLPGW